MGAHSFWHGAAWNFILWGLYYGILLILEKYIFAPLLKKLPKAARHIYTMLLVMFGWVLFSNTDFGSMRTYVGTYLVSAPKASLIWRSFYYIRNNLIILIMGVLCATPLIRNYIVRCSRKKPEVTSAVLLLLVSSASHSLYTVLTTLSFISDLVRTDYAETKR